MGKTPRLKAEAASKSKHSRAARRAASPSLDLDKSITSVARPETPSVLQTQHNSGISKKKARGKQMTRAQKRRQEKGMERAEVVLDKTETKVAKSVQSGKAVKARSAAWEDLNAKAKAHAFSSLRDNNDDEDDSEDNTMEVVDSAEKASIAAPQPKIITATADDTQVSDEEIT